MGARFGARATRAAARGMRSLLGKSDGWGRRCVSRRYGGVVLDEVVDPIEGGERADRQICDPHIRVDQELLGELDDRSVRAADVRADAALRSKARHDADDEIDLVREQRIEVDELLAC